MSESPKNTKGWVYVPSLYFAEGLPYVIVNSICVVIYKKMGIDNAQIAFWTSLLYLPWIIKMFWGPLVDSKSTKRTWIIYTQFLMSCCLGILAFIINTPIFFFTSLLIFILAAFISATHDIAVDGFYMLALSKEKQAYFVGIRSVFYRIAMIFGQGFLVYLAGTIELALNLKYQGQVAYSFIAPVDLDKIFLHNIAISWTITLGFAAILFAMLFLYHRLVLPYPELDKPSSISNNQIQNFIKAFRTYFTQEKIVIIILFILFYRFGEAMLLKLAAPFLLDTRVNGGLSISTQDLGIIYGTTGVIALIAGSIIGGWAIAKYSLKKCILPMALILNLPNLVYVYLAYTLPTNLFLIGSLVALEQFGYGFGFTAYTVYLIYISKGEYKTSHFAISTGIMALGMMFPGFISGWIQQLVGYKLFFWLVLLMGVPGIIILFFIPMNFDEEKK